MLASRGTLPARDDASLPHRPLRSGPRRARRSARVPGAGAAVLGRRRPAAGHRGGRRAAARLRCGRRAVPRGRRRRGGLPAAAGHREAVEGGPGRAREDAGPAAAARVLRRDGAAVRRHPQRHGRRGGRRRDAAAVRRRLPPPDARPPPGGPEREHDAGPKAARHGRRGAGAVVQGRARPRGVRAAAAAPRRRGGAERRTAADPADAPGAGEHGGHQPRDGHARAARAGGRGRHRDPTEGDPPHRYAGPRRDPARRALRRMARPGGQAGEARRRVPAPRGRAHLRLLELAGDDLHAAVAQLHRELGPAFAFGFGPIRFHWFVGPEAARTILRDELDAFSQKGGYDFLRPVGGDTALISSDEPAHLRRRRRVQPAFHGRQVAAWLATGEAILEPWLAQKAAHGEAFDLYRELRPRLVRIVARIVLGDVPLARDDAWLRDVDALMDFPGRPMLEQQWKLPIPGTPWARFTAARRRVDRALYAEIARRRGKGAELPDDAPRDDVLSLLMTPRDGTGGDGALSDVE